MLTYFAKLDVSVLTHVLCYSKLPRRKHKSRAFLAIWIRIQRSDVFAITINVFLTFVKLSEAKIFITYKGLWSSARFSPSFPRCGRFGSVDFFTAAASSYEDSPRRKISLRHKFKRVVDAPNTDQLDTCLEYS